MDMKKIRNAVVACIASAVVFTSCVSVEQKTGDKEQTTASNGSEEQTTETKKEVKPSFGGTLNLAMNKPETLNVIDNKIRDVADVLSLVYEPLFVLGEDEKPVPVLADSYSYDESGRGLNIKLKQGIKFHDGSTLTSEDVKFTIEYIKRNSASPYNFYALPIRRVSIEDEYNFKLYYDEPYAFAVSDLMFPILSSTYLKSANYDKNFPVGTGPYECNKFESTSFLDLKAFKDYRQKCLIEKVHAVVVNSSEEIENMFNAGLIDIFDPMAFNWLDYSETSSKKIVAYPSRNMSFIGFNFNKKDKLKKELREAIMMSINREHIGYKVFVSQVTQTDTPVLPNAYFNEDNSVQYSVDVEKAVDIVAKLGEYTKENKLKLQMLVNKDVESNEKMAEIIKIDLEQVNIDLELVLATKDEYMEKVKSGNYEMFLGNIRLSSRPDYLSLFHSRGTQNFINYSNPDMDSYIAKIINSVTEDDLKANVKGMEDIFLSDLPYVTLFFHNGGVMLNDKLKGEYVLYADNPLFGVRNLYITEE